MPKIINNNHEKMAKKIEFLELDVLVPYEKNTKIHKQYQVDQIINSIKEFGFTNPILISKENGIIAGHGRLMAAKKLKLEKVPVIRLDYLTTEQQKAYIIADNKIAENADWDINLLANELQELNALEFDVSLLGFSDDELDNFLNLKIEEEEEEEEEEEITIAKNPVTKKGDIWLLGRHRLLCGDSTQLEDYQKLTQQKKIDMLLTDPPYGVDYENKRNELGKRKNKLQKRKGLESHKQGIKHKDIANDTSKDYKQFFTDFLSIIDFNDYNTVYCFLNGQELHNLRLAYENCKIKWGDYLIWLKNNHVLTRTDYNSKHEFIVYGWKGTHKFYGPSTATTILEFNKPQKADLHSTMKPIDLLEELLSHGSKRNMTVYEPFAGSGSTLIAAENKGRICYAMELEEKYCDVIIERWQKLTGQKAILESTKEKYDDLCLKK